jgi:hypothetical protein
MGLWERDGKTILLIKSISYILYGTMGPLFPQQTRKGASADSFKKKVEFTKRNSHDRVMRLLALCAGSASLSMAWGFPML